MDKSESIFSIKHLPAVNERVKRLVDLYANGSVKRFSEMIHLSSSQKLNRVFNLDKRNNEYPEVSSDILLSIANMFVDVNTEWLLTGKGDVLKTKSSQSQQTCDNNLISNDKNNNNSSINQTFITDIIDKFLATIKNKDEKITKQAEEIGMLKQTIKQLEREKEELVSAVNGFRSANVG